jgi:hypothetical protein
MLLTQPIELAPVTTKPVLFAWPTRLLLMLIAFAGSAVYAVSFRLIDVAAALTPIAAAIGVAAGTAWIGFGFLLLTAAQMRPRRYRGVTALHWADACLLTMSVGMAAKMIGVGINAMAAAFSGGSVALAVLAPIQLAILVGTDVLMGVVFVRFAIRLGMPTRHAAMYWIIALNGIFAAVLAALIGGGVV